MDEANKPFAEAGMPDLSGAIEKLLAHPELIASVASVLGKPPPDAPKSEEREESENASSPPEESAAALPKEISPEAISALAPLLAGFSKGGGGKLPLASLAPRGDDPRVCLLLALKPYLSAGRCEAIDTMIRLSAISELLRGRNEKHLGGH